MGEPRVATAGTAFVLFDGAAFEDVPQAWFAESYWRERGLLVDAVSGRGLVLFVRRGDEHWVLRHFRRGGFVAALSEDRYLWTGLERTRAFREWRLLRELSGRGLPVSRPIAARVVRTGLSYRADLITARIENARSWASLVSAGEAQPADWRRVGLTLRRFHDEGVDHPDLNANNILVDDRREVFVVDFDRGRLRGGGRWKQRNLKRLLRSLRKISLQTGAVFDAAGWRGLLAGYASRR